MSASPAGEGSTWLSLVQLQACAHICIHCTFCAKWLLSQALSYYSCADIPAAVPAVGVT